MNIAGNYPITQQYFCILVGIYKLSKIELESGEDYSQYKLEHQTLN